MGCGRWHSGGTIKWFTQTDGAQKWKRENENSMKHVSLIDLIFLIHCIWSDGNTTWLKLPVKWLMFTGFYLYTSWYGQVVLWTRYSRSSIWLLCQRYIVLCSLWWDLCTSDTCTVCWKLYQLSHYWPQGKCSWNHE